MNNRRWLKEILLGISLVLVIAIPTISEIARPGSVLCPLRRLGKAMKIPYRWADLSFWDTFNDESRAQAEIDSAKWKAAALAKFPNLRIEAHPLPPEENGFWQLYQLDKYPHKPTAELSDVLDNRKTIDDGKAQAALAANEDWVKHIESIAAIPGRSSVDLPDSAAIYISVSPMKQAMETLLLQSILAARSKDRTGALQAMKAAGNLIDHLHKVETPTLLTETACILSHQLRLETIFMHVLPALGPSADLDAWESEMQRMKIDTAQLAIVLRGDWHVGCAFTYPLISASHYQRRLIDPDAVAMAYAEIISAQIGALRTIKLQDIPHAIKPHTTHPGLSHEGRELMDVMHFGAASWVHGYLHTARVAACHQAAMDLLQIEPCQGDLCADDAQRITLDPMTNTAFDFDPDSRTVRGTKGSAATGSDIEVTLPWKTPF